MKYFVTYFTRKRDITEKLKNKNKHIVIKPIIFPVLQYSQTQDLKVYK